MAVITIREMGEQRKEASKPVLIPWGPSSLDADNRRILSQIHNIGTDPAFNVMAELKHSQLEAAKLEVSEVGRNTFTSVSLMYPQFASALFLAVLPFEKL